MQQFATSLTATCHTGSHSVACHLMEVSFLLLLQPITAGTQCSHNGGCKADLN